MTAATLITNADIFDGENEKLSKGMSVLVDGNRITAIAKSIDKPSGAAVIDGGGRVVGVRPDPVCPLQPQGLPGRRTDARGRELRHRA